MIALDTHVLVRILVVDDEEQSRRTVQLIERARVDGADTVATFDGILIQEPGSSSPSSGQGGSAPFRLEG